MLSPLPTFFADASGALPAVDATRVTVSVNATASPQSTTYESSPSSSSGAFGNGYADLTFYPWKPLFDDASPRSLQSFLQRTSYVAIDAGGQYLSLRYSGGGWYRQDFVPGSASARWFALPNLAVVAAVGGAYLHDHLAPVGSLPSTRNIWEPWASVGVDVRAGDASVTLEWRAAGIEERVIGRPSTAQGFFGERFTLAGRVVIDRRYDVTAGAELIPDGAIGRAGFGWYPTKDLGLALGGQIEHGQIYLDTTTDYDEIRGGPTLSYWAHRRVEVWASYAPQWVSWAQGTQWEQNVTVGITGRIPAD